MEETYNGYLIKYDEFSLKFRVRIGDSDYSNASLKTVRTRIDDLDKKDFKRFDVFVGACFGGRFRAVTVTSVFWENGRMYAWTVDKDKKRSKEIFDALYEVCEENLNAIKAMQECEGRIAVIEAEKKKLFLSLKKQEPPVVTERGE